MVACVEMKIVMETEETFGEKQPATDPPWGWLVTVATFILVLLATLPGTSFGILFSDFLLELGTSSSFTFWSFNLTYVITSFITFLLMPVVEHIGWRKVTFVSGLIYGGGMILSAYATSAPFLILSFSIIAGSTSELLVTICYLVVPYYMVRWRFVANSLMTMGICVSQMLMPLMITYLQEQYGFKGATLITGALTLNCCASAMVLHPVQWHRKDSVGLNTPNKDQPHLADSCVPIHAGKSEFCPDEKQHKAFHVPIAEKKYEQKSLNHTVTGKSVEKSMFLSLECLKKILVIAKQNIKLLKSLTVSISVFVMALNITINFNVLTLVPFAMRDVGFSQRDSAFCLMVSGICNLVTRILSAFLPCCPKLKIKTLYLLGTFLAGVTIAGFSFADTVYTRALAMGLNGAGNGIHSSLYGLLIVDELGLPMLLPILANISLMTGFQFLLIGPLTGVARDVSGSYLVSLCLLAAWLVVGAVLGLAVPSTHNIQQQQQSLQQQRQEKQQPTTGDQGPLKHNQPVKQQRHESLMKKNESYNPQQFGKDDGNVEKVDDQQVSVSDKIPLIFQQNKRFVNYNSTENTNARVK